MENYNYSQLLMLCKNVTGNLLWDCGKIQTFWNLSWSRIGYHPSVPSSGILEEQSHGPPDSSPDQTFRGVPRRPSGGPPWLGSLVPACIPRHWHASYPRLTQTCVLVHHCKNSTLSETKNNQIFIYINNDLFMVL